MPIGSDMALQGRTGGRPSPLTMPRQAPPMISDSAVQAQTNNIYAAGVGGGRTAMQGMDRAGISRGRGQAARADIADALGDVQARQGAFEAETGAASANAQARYGYDAATRGEQLGYAGLLQNLRNVNAMAGITRQGFEQDQLEAIRRGQLGLDSIYLDRTPLLSGLMR